MAASDFGGHSAEFWCESYEMLRDAVCREFGDFVQDGEEAEEFIMVRAVERAAAALKASRTAPESDDADRDGTVNESGPPSEESPLTPSIND